MTQQFNPNPYPYNQQGEWVEATSVHPSIEKPIDHYAAQQTAPRFYRLPPPPPPYDPGWSDGPTMPPKEQYQLFKSAWFWVVLIEIIIIIYSIVLLVLR